MVWTAQAFSAAAIGGDVRWRDAFSGRRVIRRRNANVHSPSEKDDWTRKRAPSPGHTPCTKCAICSPAPRGSVVAVASESTTSASDSWLRPVEQIVARSCRLSAQPGLCGGSGWRASSAHSRPGGQKKAEQPYTREVLRALLAGSPTVHACTRFTGLDTPILPVASPR